MSDPTDPSADPASPWGVAPATPPPPAMPTAAPGFISQPAPAPGPPAPFNPYTSPAPGASPGHQSYVAPAAVSMDALNRLQPKADDHWRRRFKQGSVSPLYYLLSTVLLGGVTVLLLVKEGTDSFESNRYTYGDSSRYAPSSYEVSGVGWLVLIFWLLTLISYVLWLNRIGENSGDFGLGVVLAVVVLPLFVFPLLLIPVLGLVGFLVYLFWPVRKLVVGIWTSANIPRNWAVLIWATPFVAFALLMLIGAAGYTLGAERSDGSNVVLIALLFIAEGIAVIGALAWFAGPFVVSIVQHIGIENDRQDLAKSRLPRHPGP